MEASTFTDFWAWLDGASAPKQREPEPETASPLTHAFAVTGSGQRKRPNARIRQAILSRQRNRCLYCGHKFGTTVRRKRARTATLRLNWDHFVPYAYGLTNGSTNWVAACHVCNNIKSCRMFDTVREAQAYVRARWADKGYELLAPLLSSVLEEQPAIEHEESVTDMTASDMRAGWDAYDEAVGEDKSFQDSVEAGFRAAYNAGLRAAGFAMADVTVSSGKDPTSEGAEALTGREEET